MSERILVLQVGGTIACEFEDDKLNFIHPKKLIGQYLKDAKIEVKVDYYVFSSKHSTEVTGEDRVELVKFIVSTPHDRIIILYGIDPISVGETITYISSELRDKNKTIVVIGSRYTFRLCNSDASFYLGMAIGVVTFTPGPAVFSFMPGNFMPW